MSTETAIRLCVSYSIDYLLRQPDTILAGALVARETGKPMPAGVIRTFLGDLLRQGYEMVPVCDRCDAKGACQGHPYQIHELKTWPEPFEAVWLGTKLAEYRRDDRGFQVGDVLRLREYDPQADTYSGRRIEARITHVAKGQLFPEGYAMLSIQVDGKRTERTA